MDYESAVLVFDCKEEAKNGVLTYSQLREIFLEQFYDEPMVKAKMQQDPDTCLDELGSIFAQSAPKLKELLEAEGLTVDMDH